MYRLLDLLACEDNVKITPHLPMAVVDCEHVLIAVVSRSGHLIYQNRAFMKAYKVHSMGSNDLHVRETVPELWHRLSGAPKGRSDDRIRVVNLLLESSNQLLGHLLVSFQKKGLKPSDIDLLSMISREDDSRFADSYVGFYVADPKGYTLKVNPAYEKIAFLPESDLVGRNLRELEDKGYFSQSVTLRVLEGVKRGDAGDITLFQKIITGQEAVVTGKPILSTEGRLNYVLTFVHNILPLEKIACKLMDFESRSRSFPVAKGTKEFFAGEPSGTHGVAGHGLPTFDSIPLVVRDPLSFAAMRQVANAARYESPILLCGETGVGKDVIAQYIHKLCAGDNDVPFVSINCSAIPEDLLESELFGYEEGAFSGAKKGGKPGLFEEANGGTFFLNEIGEMPLKLQAKLLTVLDECCVRRLGGSRTKRIKTRIICATNRDLLQCVEIGTFRSDLYYRINVLAVRIPPIRERPRDILPLVHHFMTQLSRRYGIAKYLCPDVQDILLAYSWPGNIRELKNLVERFMVFSTSEQISVGDVPPEILGMTTTSAGMCDGIEIENGMTLKEAIRRYERRIIEQSLRKYGRALDAAAALGIDPTTLGRKLKKQ